MKENQKVSNTYKTAVKAMPQAVEPFDKEWGIGISGNTPEPSPFSRINRILKNTARTTNGFVSPERALLITEAYKKNPGAPQITKCAEAMANLLRHTPVFIHDDELIAGGLGCDKKGAPVFPEFGLNWVVDEMRDGLMDYSEQRTHDYFSYTKETQDKLESIRDFWDGKTIEDYANSLLSDDELKGSHSGKGVFFADAYIFCGAGHLGLSYERLFKIGYKGIRRLILDTLKNIDKASPDGLKKYNFLKAELLVNEAATDHIKRYAGLAKEMAQKESEETRKTELMQMHENLEWISENPPRTFWEAIQLVHIANCMIHMECNGHSISYGRFDQYMYPFFKKDVENGTATREFMQELIENFYIKIWDLNKLRSHVLIKTFGNGGIGGQCLTLGGIDREGRDATNELTYMAIDAHAHIRIPTPWLAVRLHAGTPWELKIKTANAIRLGTGEPKIFNDDVAIPSMLSSNTEVKDARDYQVVGCVEPDVTGKSYGWKDCGHMNMAKVLELAMNNGRCINCSPECKRWDKCGAIGEKLGLETGNLENFKTFDEVLEAYDKQMKYWCDRQIAVLNAVDLAHQELKPLPYLSSIMEGCIENGKDITAGGVKYNFSGPQCVGIGTTGDGLATIKQLVFEENKVTGKEFLEAVRKNWEDNESLYAYVNSDKVHHFGNDDDYADELTKFAMDTWCKHVERRPNTRGGIYQPGAYSVTVNVAFGLMQWASFEGRKAFEPLSDCMGAVHTHFASHDVSGPTAICKSVTKLDHARATNGTLLNWKFSPSSLTGNTGRDSFIALIDEYIQRKGMHSQFSVVNQETLVEAQKNPDEYRDLLIRVAGYSAYFVELSKELQDDIIGRTVLSFD